MKLNRFVPAVVLFALSVSGALPLRAEDDPPKDATVQSVIISGPDVLPDAQPHGSNSMQSGAMEVHGVVFSPATQPGVTINGGELTVTGTGTSTGTGTLNLTPGASGDATMIETLNGEKGMRWDAPNGVINIMVSPKLVKAAYVGVELTSADATLQAQLKLPEGVGLVVKGVDADGPAKAAGVQENDVIYMFGDQIAVNADQFQVLVRTHQRGDAVELTVIREAKPVKITVTLAEKDLPELSWVLGHGSNGPYWYTGQTTVTSAAPRTTVNTVTSAPRKGTLVVPSK